MTKPGDWMKDPQNLANIGHVLAGYALALTIVVFSTMSWQVLAAESAFAIYVLLKEYVYDLREETGENLKSSTVDALGYVAGNVVGWIVILLSGRVTVVRIG